MYAGSFSRFDFDGFERTLTDAIRNAQSLEEIEVWLKSQDHVKTVQLAGYLLKSNPPQRDFIVEFGIEDGSSVKKIVNVFQLGEQHFQFHKLRDQ